MMWIYLLGYVSIAGVILMDQGHQLDQAKRIVRKKLSHFNIKVDITLHDNDQWTIEATKQLGINIKHAVVHSTNAVSAVNILVSDINNNFDQWVEQETYGS